MTIPEPVKNAVPAGPAERPGLPRAVGGLLVAARQGLADAEGARVRRSAAKTIIKAIPTGSAAARQTSLICKADVVIGISSVAN